MPPPTRCGSWPSWPSITASTNCASRTRRTSSCRMCEEPISTRCGRSSTRPVSARPISTRSSDIIACPGLDYCSLANARSIPVAQKISQRFAANGKGETLGELKLKISGCINACGHHHAGHIGILGVDKKGVENYQLSLGGSEAEDTSLGKITGPGFDEDGVVDAVETATDVYLRAAPGWRALPRHLSPHRHGPVQGGALWLMPAPECEFRFRDDEPVSIRPSPSTLSPNRPTPLAVRIEPGDDARAVAAVPRPARLVEVNFPAFGDGRGYSAARILREAGYTGELRAVGDVLVDQIAYMRRCGFDTFAPDKPLDEAMRERAFPAGRMSISTPPMDACRSGTFAMAEADPSRVTRPASATASTLAPRFSEADAIRLNRMFRGRRYAGHAAQRDRGRAGRRTRDRVQLRRGKRGAAASGCQIDPSLPVLFLDTGKHFAETLAYRDLLVERLGLTGLRNLTPDPDIWREGRDRPALVLRSRWLLRNPQGPAAGQRAIGLRCHDYRAQGIPVLHPRQPAAFRSGYSRMRKAGSRSTR